MEDREFINNVISKLIEIGWIYKEEIMRQPAADFQRAFIHRLTRRPKECK
jgi:hypothetical protein